MCLSPYNARSMQCVQGEHRCRIVQWDSLCVTDVIVVGKKAKHATKSARQTPETAPISPAVSEIPTVRRRTLPPIYGWAVRSEAMSAAATPAPSHVPVTAASSAKHHASAAASATGAARDQRGADDICKERRRKNPQKPKVRYASPNNCVFMSCGPTKPLRTFREKPDSCLPRRK